MTPAWLTSACALLEHESAIVRVTVARTRGSSPRETGATMLVSPTRQWDTIGGGQLEWQAVEQARQMICDPGGPAARIEPLRLGPDLAQCCGGEVILWLERLVADELPALRILAESLRNTALRTRLARGGIERDAVDAAAFPAARESRPRKSTVDEPVPHFTQAARLCLDPAAVELTELHATARQPLWIFGAGHVGQAMLRLLQSLPLFDVTCIDSRPDIHPDALRETGIAVLHVAEPVENIGMAPPGTCFLVLTHDHELDYQLCAAILARGDARWLGLIGSSSKAARFRSRLRRAQFDAPAIAQLVSPVGLTAIRSKLPAAIAIGITAQLLELASEQSAVRHIVQAPLAVAACDPACGRCAERRPA